MKPPQVYQFEGFRLDVRRRLLSKDGKPLPLRPKVFKTLLLLIQNAGERVTKDQLINWIKNDYSKNIDEEFGEILITAGAGDIDMLVEPIKESLNWDL